MPTDHPVHKIKDEMSTAGNTVTTFTYYDAQANETTKSTPDPDIVPTAQRIKDYWAAGRNVTAWITINDEDEITHVSYEVEKPE